MQQPPEVVARIREGGAGGRTRQTGIDAAEDESDSGREDVRNDRVGQAASGSRASRRSSRSIRSFSPTSLDSSGDAPPRGSTLTIDPWEFMSEKTLKGTFLGSARIQEDVPRLIDLYHSGELELDRLVSRKLPLAELPDAFDRLRAGDVVRQVVVFD